MYEQNKISNNWFKIGLRILVVILCIILLVRLIIMIKNNQTNVVEEDQMKEKLDLLEEAGSKYFTDGLLPKEIGESITITLSDLINETLVDEIKDTKDKTCDINKSYVKVIRLDEEYQIKTYLKCDDYENHKDSYLPMKEEANKDKTTTTTTKKTKKKKTTTTQAIKKYTISFNTNGGELLDNIKVNENKTITNVPTPVRTGYKFIGWYYHGSEFNLNTIINQDYVLVAKWVAE